MRKLKVENFSIILSKIANNTPLNESKVHFFNKIKFKYIRSLQRKRNAQGIFIILSKAKRKMKSTTFQQFFKYIQQKENEKVKEAKQKLSK